MELTGPAGLYARPLAVATVLAVPLVPARLGLHSARPCGAPDWLTAGAPPVSRAETLLRRISV
jgi:hypothetical protein